MRADLGATSTGLSPAVAACLAYSTWWVSGLLMLAIEPSNRFVRFHAWQATVGFGALWLISLGLWGLSFLTAFVSPLAFRVAGVLAPLAWAAAVVTWLACLWQAGHGRRLELPWVGSWASARAGSPPRST